MTSSFECLNLQRGVPDEHRLVDKPLRIHHTVPRCSTAKTLLIRRSNPVPRMELNERGCVTRNEGFLSRIVYTTISETGTYVVLWRDETMHLLWDKVYAERDGEMERE